LSRGRKERTLRRRTEALRAVAFLGLLLGFVYQASDAVVHYLSYPTTNDVRVEGSELVSLPAVSLCLTNWVSRERFCRKYRDLCNNTNEEELRGHVEAILEKGERVGELAMSSSDILQVVMDNPGMSIFPSGFPEE
ncbi:unnamed protein product, partial [Ixodes persulcatus]